MFPLPRTSDLSREARFASSSDTLGLMDSTTFGPSLEPSQKATDNDVTRN